MAHQELNLELGLAPYDPWVFNTRLTDYDHRYGGSLILQRHDFESAIWPELDRGRAQVLEMEKGIQVKVLVVEEGSEYTVTLIRYNGQYMFRSGWYDIVRARGFKTNDVIGLFWDKSSERFYLHHLK